MSEGIATAMVNGAHRGAGTVTFEHVWKKFHRGERQDSLRDLLPLLARRAVRARSEADELGASDFWALRDVSFEVRAGEALGIIGPNGAGKSTILKLLTRILRPTHGRCAATGRVGALIEIAAGFHPDLTGRENVFLQGAIMGMRRAEIARKFDEIVEFAGIPGFLDTPVKRYSSGMHARLGFAIAAHLDPDVLVIDEVLGVGDAAFQRRAYERLRELRRRDIPVIVVSHQLDRIADLCTTALLLRRGEVVHAGTPQACIAAYAEADRAVAPGDATTLCLTSLHAPQGAEVRSGDRLVLELAGWASGPAPDESIGIRLRSAQSGEVVFTTDTRRLATPLPAEGAFVLTAELQFNVPAGTYLVEGFLWHVLRDVELLAGPSTAISVWAGENFWGAVQCNPRLSVRAQPDPGRT
jgi:ABC-type polysaccharide/polyol phosphate transport system ATPase subunit